MQLPRSGRRTRGRNRARANRRTSIGSVPGSLGFEGSRLEHRLLLVHDLAGLFRLDGQAVNPTPGVAPHDWSDVFFDFQNPGSDQSGTGGSFTFVTDPVRSSTDDIFQASKDTEDINGWRWRLGQPQPKDDIEHAYGGAYTYTGPQDGNVNTGDKIVVLGMDRVRNNGTSTVGFWLFQDKVAPNPDGTFSGLHTDGDILIVSDFSQGGGVATINVFRWSSTHAGHLLPVSLPTDTAFGIVNDVTVPSPWPFTSEAGPDNEFQPGQFFEIGVDLSAIFPGVEVPCYHTFVAETRASDSPTADLSDFVAGTLNTCPPPVVVDQAYDCVELGNPLPFTVEAPGVLTGASDQQQLPLTAVLVTGPQYGTFSLAPSGAFTYTPDPNNPIFASTIGSHVIDSFTYRASNGFAESSIGTATLEINRAPVVPPLTDLGVVNEGASATTGVIYSDLDGDTLTVTITVPPTQGTVVDNGDGTFTYTANVVATGGDSFTYEVNDGCTTRTGQVTVNVDGNPTVADQAYDCVELGTDLVQPPPGLLTGAIDPGQQLLTISNFTQPQFGSVVVNPDGSFTYSPPDPSNPIFASTVGSHVIDTFTYRASDGLNLSNIGTASLVINRAPVADSADLGVVNEGASATTGVIYGDDDGPVIVTITVPPTKGTVVNNFDGTFTYTAGSVEAGADSFTYEVNDGCTTRTGEVTVAINGNPTVVDQTYNCVDLGLPFLQTAPGVLLGALDPGQQPLTVAEVTGPQFGTLTLNPDGAFSYTPDPSNPIFASTVGSHVIDTFTYQASDGLNLSNIGTASLVINRAPVADSADLGVVNEGASATTGVIYSDLDGDTLTVTITVPPTQGTVVDNGDGTFTYTANVVATGGDSFTYQVYDGCTIRTGQVTVNVDGNPTVRDQAYDCVDLNTALVEVAPGVLTGALDPGQQPLTVAEVTGPQFGTLTLNPDGSFTYTPDPSNPIFASTIGSHVIDTFTYQASDGLNLSNIGTATLEINRAPVADSADLGTINEGASANTGVLYGDVDGDTLIVTITVPPTKGTVVDNFDGSFTYTAGSVEAGADSFTYEVNDGCTIRTGEVTVAINGAPTVQDQSYDCVDLGTPFTQGAPGVLLGATDPGGQPLTVAVVSPPVYGSVVLNSDGSFTYSPPDPSNPIFASTVGSHVIDTFTYQASDGLNLSNVGTANLVLNRAPTIAPPAPYSVVQGASLNVAAGTGLLSNVSDADGDPLVITANTNPLHGTLVVNADGSFTYAPDPTFRGTDSFTYEVFDGCTTVTATAQVRVGDVAPAELTRFQLFGIHHQPTRLVLTFSTAMDPQSVTDLTHYQLVRLRPHSGLPGRPIRLRSATYDPATFSITIRPLRHLYLFSRYRFTASGLLDAQGIPLDGDGDGTPGGDLVITFRGVQALRGQIIRDGSPVPTVTRMPFPRRMNPPQAHPRRFHQG
jgi:VCBS repeat-containing protein